MTEQLGKLCECVFHSVCSYICRRDHTHNVRVRAYFDIVIENWCRIDGDLSQSKIMSVCKNWFRRCFLSFWFWTEMAFRLKSTSVIGSVRVIQRCMLLFVSFSSRFRPYRPISLITITIIVFVVRTWLQREEKSERRFGTSMMNYLLFVELHALISFMYRSIFVFSLLHLSMEKETFFFVSSLDRIILGMQTLQLVCPLDAFSSESWVHCPSFNEFTTKMKARSELQFFFFLFVIQVVKVELSIFVGKRNTSIDRIIIAIER